MASALTLLGDAVSGRVLEALADTGLRHGHGYLIQRLLIGPATATEIADELGVTQQGVSKAVNELIRLGHLETLTDATDGRRRPLRLTRQGRRAIATARAARAEINDRFLDALGEDRFSATRDALLTALEALDLGGPTRRRAVPPAPGMLA